MNKRYRNIIVRQPLFQGVNEEQLDTMLSCLDVRYQRFAKHELLIQEGEAFSKVGIVLEGSVRIISEDIWGNRSIQTQIEVGDIFGEAFACAGTSESPVSVMAAEDTLILMMDYGKIVRTCSSSCVFHHRLIENMMKLLAGKNIILIEKMQYLTRKSTREKLLAYLHGEARTNGKAKFIISFNRQELADYLSVDRSAMSHELSKLQREGILSFYKNEFELYNKKKDQI